ncbi:MAG TPA: 30S ribosomal protein S6 [Candidatus Hydrogenedentes bacterium]|nr:30S ribosomal protein S6 [Candidatus Hydrogenedentota bacterium]
MRTYEALFIIAPTVDDDGIQAVVREVEEMITSSGGTIARTDIWGRRKLAYPIRKFTDGVYVVMRFQATQEMPRKLDNYFKLSEQVIRSLVLYMDERTLKLEAEQARRREEEARLAATRVREEDDSDEDDEYEGARGRRRGRRMDDEEYED